MEGADGQPDGDRSMTYFVEGDEVVSILEGLSAVDDPSTAARKVTRKIIIIL